MPTGGWQGLTADDESQAVNICNVMKQFTDQGIEVWLRFVGLLFLAVALITKSNARPTKSTGIKQMAPIRVLPPISRLVGLPWLELARKSRQKSKCSSRKLKKALSCLEGSSFLASPNVADLGTYESFYPEDPSTVQVIGVDYYVGWQLSLFSIH
jgi:hypothetical protein